MSFLKVFFPSWNFFNTYNDLPTLEFKIPNTNSWQKVFSPPQRTFWFWFINPRVNYLHAVNNHLLLWLQELQVDPPNHGEALLQNSHFKIAKKMAEQELRIKNISMPYELRLVLISVLDKSKNVILEFPVSM